MGELQIIERRTVFDKDFKIYGDFENPLFLAKDVADWIEHSDVSTMMRNVDESEKVTNIVCTLGGNQEAWFLTEDGLYEVLMQSRKPIAKQFKSKVKEILKDIRKHGMYATAETLDMLLNDPDTAIALLTRYKDEKQQKEALQIENENLQRQLDESKSFYTIKRVAQINGISWKNLDYRKLKRQSILMNRQIQKIFDANFGEVNSYHVDVFRTVYPQLIY